MSQLTLTFANGDGGMVLHLAHPISMVEQKVPHGALTRECVLRRIVGKIAMCGGYSDGQGGSVRSGKRTRSDEGSRLLP